MDRQVNDVLELNAMLMYEFYVSIAEAIEKNNIIVSEEIIIQDNNYMKKKSKQEIAKKDNIILKNINKKIIKLVGLKNIYIMKLDYEVLSISEHKIF